MPVLTHTQVAFTPVTKTFSFQYFYNLAGMTAMRYPSGREVGYDVDGTSGRITAVRASTGYYARNMSYWPSWRVG